MANAPSETPLTDEYVDVQHTVGGEEYQVVPAEFARSLETRVAALENSLTALLRQTSNIEVLGEWSALDMNYKTSKKYRAQVDAVIAEARALLEKRT